MSFALGRIAFGASSREERSRSKSRSSRIFAIDPLLQEGDHTVGTSFIEEYEESKLRIGLPSREARDYGCLGKAGAYGSEHTHCSMYMHLAD